MPAFNCNGKSYFRNSKVVLYTKVTIFCLVITGIWLLFLAPVVVYHAQPIQDIEVSTFNYLFHATVYYVYCRYFSSSRKGAVLVKLNYCVVP